MAAAFCLIWPGLAGAAPTISNIRCAQVAGTKRVEVRYDVRATGVTAVKVKLEISANAGSSDAVPVATLRGAVGLGVPVGLDRLVVLEAGQEWDQQVSAQMRVRITADDAPPTAAESGMVLIPGGIFTMGDGLDELIDAPQHQVTLSAYLLGRTEVTKALWDEVTAWALPRGYAFLQVPRAEGPDHPVAGMAWLDAVVWCNARSEREGLKPVYYTAGSPTIPFRVSENGISSTPVDWTANGYRLPTEAEWERSRGGGFTGGIG
jgi:formylglycine-generating enzyme required for sulfatase activity